MSTVNSFFRGSGRHHRRSENGSVIWLVAGVLVLAVVATLGVTWLVRDRVAGAERIAAGPGADCDSVVAVVAASSFVGVLTELAAGLGTGPDCLRLDITVADGRVAPGRAVEVDADVWIPDDTSWAGIVPQGVLAAEDSPGYGTVLASSPIYMATDPATAERLRAVGGSWGGLMGLLQDGSGVRLAVRDPDSSGDGMVAAGGLAEAVWLTDGMDASALALGRALKTTRTVADAGPALPREPGEVGLVPEYALLGDGTALASDTVLMPGSDFSALLRHTWFPMAVTGTDPARRDAADRLLTALRGPDGGRAVAAAGLRAPDGAAPPPGSALAVESTPPAPAFEVLGAHHVDHVFASWYAKDRETSILLVIDVSGSMQDIVPGGTEPLIDLVGQGCLSVAELLPDESALGLWEFGSLLAPPADHRTLLPTAPLTADHRGDLAGAIDRLATRGTGTGLYDTIAAAYESAADNHRDGVPNQVLIFTDGRNEDDPGSITVQQMTERLVAANDPARPVYLTVVAFGDKPEAGLLAEAVKPVQGYVSKVDSVDGVAAAFVHVAAGGLH